MKTFLLNIKRVVLGLLNTGQTGSTNFKGTFADEAALLSVYPNNIANPADRIGWNIINTQTDTFWVWGEDENKWINTSVNQNTNLNQDYDLWADSDIDLDNKIKFLNTTTLGGRIHFKTDITLSKNYTWNLDKIRILGEKKFLHLNTWLITITSTSADFDEVYFKGDVINQSTSSQKIITVSNSPVVATTSRYYFKNCVFYDLVGTSSANHNLIDVVSTSNPPALSCHFEFLMCSHRIQNFTVNYTGIKNTGSLLDFTIQTIDQLSQASGARRWAMNGNLASNTTIFRTDNSTEFYPFIAATVEYMHPKDISKLDKYFSAYPEKTTLADNDFFVINDSADSYEPKYVKKSVLKTVAITPATYTIPGEIKVPVGDTDFINPWVVSLAAGQTAKIKSATHLINSGTSATCKLTKNGADITGFTAISVTTAKTTTTPTAVSIADSDVIALVVSAVNGTPKNLSFGINVEYTTVLS